MPLPDGAKRVSDVSAFLGLRPTTLVVSSATPVEDMKLSDAEWTVMNAVWESSPATARDVLEHCEAETSWAYTTVKTLLARLVDKGALAERKRANTSMYEPRVTRTAARRSALRSLLDKAFDGAFGPLLQHMVSDEKLSKRDRTELTTMLGELEEERRAAKPRRRKR